MTARERMEQGLIYDPNDKDIMEEQTACLELLYDFNATRPSELEKRESLLRHMFAQIGKDCYIEPPLHANWGGRHVFLGDGVPVYGAKIAESGLRFRFAPAHMNRQRAAALCVRAAQYFKEGRTQTADEHRPEYLRLSQAERERLEKERAARQAADSGKETPQRHGD